MNKAITFLSLITILSLQNIVSAESMPLPMKNQVVMFLKILPYDYELKKRGDNLKIGAISFCSSESKVAKDSFLNELKEYKDEKIGEQSFSYQEISSLDTLKNNPFDIVYISPGCKNNLNDIKKITLQKKIITITGVPEYVYDGFASISINLKNNKPKIMVNIQNTKDEGSNFSANLLKLAEVIK
jgi:hypothetical protein